MSSLMRLWNGEIALGRAFWEYAVVYGALANLIATITAFAIVVANGPVGLALAVFLLPVPYNIAAAVGVWRSTARYHGPPQRAQLARIAVVAWAIFLSLA
jgi:hypothetical protein